MREIYDICRAIFQYFGVMINVVLDVLFYQVPVLDVSIMQIIFGPGLVIYVAFVIAKFVKGIII